MSQSYKLVTLKYTIQQKNKLAIDVQNGCKQTEKDKLKNIV